MHHEPAPDEMANAMAKSTEYLKSCYEGIRSRSDSDPRGGVAGFILISRLPLRGGRETRCTGLSHLGRRGRAARPWAMVLNRFAAREGGAMKLVTTLVFVLCIRLPWAFAGEEEEPWDMLTAKPEVVEAVAGHAVRHVHLLGTGQPDGPGDRLVARRAAGRRVSRARGAGADAGRGLRQPLQEVEARQVRRSPVGPIAQDAGMKYMIFLVKHHDGFCLYDTKLTDYRSTGPESAWKVDVMKQRRRRLPRGGPEADRLLLATRLAPSRLPHEEPRSLHRVPARPGARAADQLRPDRRVLVRPWRETGGLGHRQAVQDDAHASAVADHQQPLRPARRFRHARAAARQFPARPPLGNVHDPRHPVVVETGRQDQVAQGVHRRAGHVRGAERQPGPQHGPHARRPDRAPPGRACSGRSASG